MKLRRFFCLLLVCVVICSAVFSVSVSAASYNVSKIDISNCIKDIVYNDDDATVTYSVPLKPYADIYATPHGATELEYLMSSNGINFSQDIVSSTIQQFKKFSSQYSYTSSLGVDGGKYCLYQNTSNGNYNEQLYSYARNGGWLRFGDTYLPFVCKEYIESSTNYWVLDTGENDDIWDGELCILFHKKRSSGVHKVMALAYGQSEKIQYPIEIGTMNTVVSTSGEYDNIKAFYYPLGFTNANFNVIDIADIKSGSQFDINIKYHLNIEIDGEPETKYHEFNAVFLDDTGEVLNSKVFTNDNANTNQSYKISATVPDGARYLIIKYDTTLLDISKVTRFEVNIDNIELTANVTAIKANSMSMKNIENKLEEIKENQNSIGSSLEDIKENQETINNNLSDIKEEQKTSNTILGNVVEKVTELPQKIAEKVSDAVTKLFVPTEEDMIEYSDTWEMLLEDRFGAVYESSEIMDDFATAFTYTGNQEEITIPTLTVNLAGTNFNFGGWSVQVVPDGFDGLITALKMIVNVVCTLLFINGMKKRLEEVLG